MTVHMVRVICEPPKGEAENAIQNWVENYTEWDADPVEHSLSEQNTELDGSGTAYFRGDWRFVQDGEDPTAILTDLSDRLQGIQDGLWHRLAYHVCSHDEDNPTPCSWGEMVEQGTVPSGVQTFEVA